MLSAVELASCKDLLISARIIARWTSDLLHNDGDLGAASRLRRIADLLDSEIRDLDRLLNTPQRP